MCYNDLVRSARSFCAPRTMRPRHAVLLTPSTSVRLPRTKPRVPTQLLFFCNQTTTVTHLESTLVKVYLLTSWAQFSLQGADKERLTVFSDGAGGTMAEVGPLPFARVALQVATQVLPPYRTRFSKHQFTQPQLLAVLCLMRYEDWTLRRLEDDTVDRGLQETVRRLRRRRSRPISAAIDGTGLSDTSVSTFFHRRLEQHAHGTRPRRPWLKWLIVVDVRQQILLAQRARQGPGCDARALPGLLDVAAQGAPLGVVLADAEFDSEANHQHIRQRLGAKSIIPARRRGVPNGAIRNQMFRAFPKKPYRQRNKIESVFSAVKRKLSSRAPGRSLTTQIRQALLLGLAYNIYRLRHRFAHRGCQQSPSVLSSTFVPFSTGRLLHLIEHRIPTSSLRHGISKSEGDLLCKSDATKF